MCIGVYVCVCLVCVCVYVLSVAHVYVCVCMHVLWYPYLHMCAGAYACVGLCGCQRLMLGAFYFNCRSIFFIHFSIEPGPHCLGEAGWLAAQDPPVSTSITWLQVCAWL